MSAEVHTLLSIPAYCSLHCACVTVYDAGDHLAGYRGVHRPSSRAEKSWELTAYLAAMWAEGELGVGECGRPVRVGLAAYEAWLADMQAAKRLSRRRLAVLSERVSQWVDIASTASQSMACMAGKSTARSARLLRDAAHVHLSHLQARLLALQNPPSRGKRGYCVDQMSHAGTSARATCLLVAESLRCRGSVPPHVAAALFAERLEAVEPVAMDELLYLVRAAIPPLRILALRSLAQLRDPRATAVIRECAHDDHPLCASVATWALGARASRMEESKD